jgi:hypothetical protein
VHRRDLLGITFSFFLCGSNVYLKKTDPLAELETLWRSLNKQHGKPREADELHPVSKDIELPWKGAT